MTRKPEEPILTFVADQPCPAEPDEVYALIATPSTHLQWAGRDAGKADGLFELHAEEGQAEVGSVFTSSGGKTRGAMTFHDRSVVTDAEPGRLFAFATESRLPRPRRPEWRARFVHRYELSRTDDGTLVHYTCQVWPVNYRPYWLHPLMRPVTKRLMRAIMMQPHLENLARLVAVP